MSEQIETTMQDVLGARPFEGRDGFRYVRVTVVTWLLRQGWKGKVVAKIPNDQMVQIYTNFGDCTEYSKMYGQPTLDEQRAKRVAAAPYIPKTQSVINVARRKKLMGIKPLDEPVVDDSHPAQPALNEAEIEAMVSRLIAKQKPVEVTIKMVQAEKVGVIKGTKHPKMPMLAKAGSARMLNGYHPNIWLFGPTASGKTHSAEQLADGMKRKFYMHGAMSMIHELMGYKDANGKYHTTPFRECYEKGGVCLLDECDSWDAAVTLALNGALANGITAFPDGMVRRHKDSLFIAAGNTVGAGATIEFVGRNKLDAAFMSRFPIKIEWPRDPEIEKAISGNDEWTARVVAARQRAAAAGIKHAIDPRHTQAGAALIAVGMTMDEAAELTYLAGLPEAQRRTVEGIF